MSKIKQILNALVLSVLVVVLLNSCQKDRNNLFVQEELVLKYTPVPAWKQEAQIEFKPGCPIPASVDSIVELMYPGLTPRIFTTNFGEFRPAIGLFNGDQLVVSTFYIKYNEEAGSSQNGSPRTGSNFLFTPNDTCGWSLAMQLRKGSNVGVPNPQTIRDHRIDNGDSTDVFIAKVESEKDSAYVVVNIDKLADRQPVEICRSPKKLVTITCKGEPTLEVDMPFDFKEVLSHLRSDLAGGNTIELEFNPALGIWQLPLGTDYRISLDDQTSSNSEAFAAIGVSAKGEVMGWFVYDIEPDGTQVLRNVVKVGHQFPPNQIRVYNAQDDKFETYVVPADINRQLGEYKPY